MTRTTIGIIGYGRFGRVLHRLFEDGFEIYGSSSTYRNGDIEGITQADFSEANTVYVINENVGRIQELDLSEPDNVVLVNDWNVSTIIGGDGGEGITFVPDEFLAEQGFVTEAGDPYQSVHGMGGIMLVGHQAGGWLYAFDLNRETGEWSYLGRFGTAATETAGLEFDRSTGDLLIWHDADFDQLEVSRLSSTLVDEVRSLDPLVVYDGPPWVLFISENHEGIAVAPIDDCVNGERNFFFITDGGRSYALLLFVHFPCSLP